MPPSTPRSSIREQIAAKRAEVRQATPARPQPARKVDASRVVDARDGSGDGKIEERTVSGQISKAAKSGKLDIANLALHRLPPQLYTELLGIPPSDLTNPASPPKPAKTDVKGMTRSFSSNLRLAEGANDKAQVFGKGGEQERAWVEPEEMTSLKAGGNDIEKLEYEMGGFGGLKLIDLARNRIVELPSSFADLLRLTSADLSHNKLSSIPPALLLLPALEVLDLSHNAISAIDLSNPTHPTDEGLGYGAGFLSTSFARNAANKAARPVWPVLKNLDLGNNRLTTTGLGGLTRLESLRILNLESNELDGIIDVDKLDLPGLTSLHLSKNHRLIGTSRDLGTNVRVNLEGCNIKGISVPRSQSAGEPASSKESPTKPTSDLPVPQPDMTLVYRTLPAATFDSEPLAIELDLYLPSCPSTSEKGHPLVVWFHGGGLLQGNKENLPPHFRRLPSYTYTSGESVAVISPNYRLAPQVPIWDILSDLTSLLTYIRTRLNAQLKGGHKTDTSRICLSGGSAGGYLALIAGLPVPPECKDEDVGGYRGEQGIRCIAPFYPITDLTDQFWATETNPVPWAKRSVPHAEARPHIDPKAAPIATTISGGPRSILYSYMLQHALFPSLLFLRQRAIGSGLDAFRPEPACLSIPQRLDLLSQSRKTIPHVPVYFVYGTIDDKVQPMESTLTAFERLGANGRFEVERREGADHGFDEEVGEECLEFREWLGRTLL